MGLVMLPMRVCHKHPQGTPVKSPLLRQYLHQSNEGIESHSGTSNVKVFLIAPDQLMTPVYYGDSITRTSQCFEFCFAKENGGMKVVCGSCGTV